jgi:hypothetical protein
MKICDSRGSILNGLLWAYYLPGSGASHFNNQVGYSIFKTPCVSEPLLGN